MLPKLIHRLQKHETAIILILILFFALLIRCYEITLPYGKTWEIAFQEIIAKNHFIYGFNQTHFVSVISVVDGQNIYHLSHPPLLQIFIAFSYFLFGVHEWSARIIPVLFSLGTIILIFTIADRIWGRRAAIITAFLTAFMPMSAYFGRIVNFEPPVLFFILLFTWSYLVWDETSDRNYFFIALIAIILGGLTDWPFFMVLPFFVLISLVTRKKIRETIFLFLFGCGIAAGYLFLKNNLVGYKSGVSDWFGHILFRSNIPAFIGNPELYFRILTRMWSNFSLAIILAVIGIGISVYIHRKNRVSCHDLTVKELIPAALLLFGLSYLFIFLESTYTHEWQMYYLIPGVSLYAGFALSYLISCTTTNKPVKILIQTGCIVILILFLFLSAQSLITFHDEKNFESYYFGSRINEWTAKEDYISVIGLIYPITYYADRPTVQSPIDDLPDLSQIQKLRPKIVAFPPYESFDSRWNRTEFRHFLEEENYHLLTARPFFEMWVQDIVVPDVLAHGIDSVEVRDPQSGENIPDIDTRGYVAHSYFSDSRAALFEHALSKGVIRTNYRFDIPEGSVLTFGIGLNEKTWDPKLGDGVLFEVFCQAGSNETRIFSQYMDPKNNPADRKWLYYSIPLDPCSGHGTRISFATSPGPKNDNVSDWAYWMDPRIESKNTNL